MKTDSQIQKDVQEELKWTPQVNAAEIGVAVNNGIVSLTGTVKTYAEKLAAEKTAKRVLGVRAVADELKVGASFGAERTDKEIAQAVLSALGWHTTIDQSKIKVTVDSGFVVLEGQVDWEFQRRAARTACASLIGVKWIDNKLTLKPYPAASDIRQKILNAYERSATIDASMINVDVIGSKVILTGKVRSLPEKEDAAKAAWSAPGIIAVDNELKVVLQEEYAY